MKFRLKLFTVAATALTLGSSLTGFAGATKAATLAADSKQHVNVMESSDLVTLDPSKAQDLISFDALTNSMEGLYRVGKDQKVVPGLATSVVTPTNDGKTYTFTLRKDAKWSDGTPVTAKDFVYSWRRTVNPKTKAGYSYIFDNVVNAQEIMDGKKSPDTLGVKADNDYQLTVNLTRATPYFKYLLAFGTYFPENEKAVKKYGSSYGTTAAKAVYNGPFQLKGWNGTNNKWTLAKSKDYWDASNVHLNKLTVQVVKEPSTALNLFQNHNLDDAILSGEMAKQEAKKPTYVANKQAQIGYLDFNFKHKVTANANVRKAISLVMNRKQLTKNVLSDGSVAAEGFVPAKFATNPQTNVDFTKDTYTKAAVTTDKTQAKQLWKQGLKQLGKKHVKLTLLTSDVDSMKKVGAYVQSAIEQELPGAKVTVSSLPYKTYQTRMEDGSNDIVLARWIGDYPDPATFMQLKTPGTAYNYGQYNNKTYADAVNKANTTDANDPQARYNDFVTAEKQLMNDQAVSPLFQASDTHLRNQNFKGVVYHQTGAPYDYKWAYVAK